MGSVLLLVAGLCECAGWPFAAGPLQRLVSQRLDRAVVSDGGFELYLLGSPRLRAGHIRIEDNTGVSGRPLLDAQRPEVHARWRDLLALGEGRPLRLVAASADQLTLHLRRQADGQANWHFHRAGDLTGLSTITGVREQQLAVPHVDVRLDDALHDLHMQLAIRGPQHDRNGQWTAHAEGRWRTQPTTAQARASGNVSAVALVEGGHYLALDASARVGSVTWSFDGSVMDPRGAARWDGALNVTGPSLGAVGELLGLSLPEGGPFSLRGRLRQQGSLWSLDTDQAKVGRSQLAGSLTYNRADPRRGTVTGTVTGRVVSLQDLGLAVGRRSGSAHTTAPGVQQRGPAHRSVDAIDADVEIRLQRLALGQPGVPDLSPVNTTLRLHDGDLTLAEGDRRGALSLLPSPALGDLHPWSPDTPMIDKARRAGLVLARDKVDACTRRVGRGLGAWPAWSV